MTLTRILPENLSEVPLGQCQLMFSSGTTITLTPYDGNLIAIDSLVYRIPSAGVSMAYGTALIEGGALANNTSYYVYIRDNLGSLEIQASSSLPVVDAYTGMFVRTSTPEWALVGTVATAVGAFASVITHFNVPLSYLLNRANHTGGQDASTITSGVFDIARIPATALSRLVTVANQAARYALTTADVQNGDTVLQVSGTPNNQMFFVVDDTNLGNSAGYQIYTATTDWITITNKPQILLDLAAITSPAINDSIWYIGGAWVKQSLSQAQTLLGVNNLSTTILATLLAGLSLADASQVTAANSILVSIGKLQAQANLKLGITSSSASVSSSAGVVTVDAAQANTLLLLTLTENVTSWNITNLPAAGYRDIEVQITQDAAVAYTCVSPASAGKTAGGPWLVSGTLGAIEILGLRIFASGSITCFPSGVLG